MMQPRLLFFGTLCMLFAYEAYAMKCDLVGGISFNCPTILSDDDSKAFCCKGSGGRPYCCDLPSYIQNNSAIMAGIVIGVLVIFLLIPICCCCCLCAACPLARGRVHRGIVIVR